MNATVLVHPDIGDPFEITNALIERTQCQPRVRGSKHLCYVAFLLDEARRVVEFKRGLPVKAITHYQEVQGVHIQPVRVAAELADESSPPQAA